jgi:hypothetical protein
LHSTDDVASNQSLASYSKSGSTSPSQACT